MNRILDSWPAHGEADVAAAPVVLAHEAPFSLPPLHVEPALRRMVRDDGADTIVEPLVMQVLVALARAKGDILTRDELVDSCWSGRIVGDDSIARVIALVRKLGAGFGQGAFTIETITKVGYRLLAPEAEGGEQKAARLVAVHGRGNRLNIDREAPPAPTASVAVLSFTNLTGDPDKAYLADGMAEELIGTLARSPAIKVPARTSSFAYRGREVDIRTIARELGVDTVLEGSVRSAGERIRVTAQLIEAESGCHLWTESYDRNIGDLFALQDELAGAIATALKVQLGVTEPPTPDLEAYQLYLRALGLIGVQCGANVGPALALLDEALERDPGFARGYAARASVIQDGLIHFLLGPEWRANVISDADRALALDPQLRWIGGERGLHLAGECKWCAADEEFRATLEIRSSDPVVRNRYGLLFLIPVGHLAKAQASIEDAIRIAPALPISVVLKAFALSLRGDQDAADKEIRFALQLGFGEHVSPMGGVRTTIAAERGDFTAAANLMGQAMAPALRDLGGVATADRVYSALAGDGDRTAASEEVNALFERAKAGGVLNWNGAHYGLFICWLVRLGAIDLAFAIAGSLVGDLQEHGFIQPAALSLLWLPGMRPFREDPRFQDFVRALNMFEYWEKHGPPDGHALVDGRLVCI